MYSPHTVSVISFYHDVPYLTVLRGVMLQAVNGQSVFRSGDREAVAATLYIPLSVRAENPAGEAVRFLPPRDYARCPDPEKHWTLQPEGESAGRGSFFVKGALAEPCTLADVRETLDFVYVVSAWQLHDYGARGMQHFEVLSRISSRLYREND